MSLLKPNAVNVNNSSLHCTSTANEIAVTTQSLDGFPQLSKEADDNLLEMYFRAILELAKISETEFIVDFDKVWPIAYKDKRSAIHELKDKFIKDIDYQTVRRKVQASNMAGFVYSDMYLMNVPCLEYFVARRVPRVFEIYRRVFHKTVEAVGAAGQVDPSQLPGLDEALMAIMDKYPNIPQTYGEALMEAGRFFNEKESLKNKVIETTARANKAEALSDNLQNIISSNEHKMLFYDNVLKVDEGMVSLDEAAKRLSAFGINVNYKAFVSFLKEIKFLIKGKSGRFSLSANAIRKGYASYRVVESYVFGKKIPCNVIVMTDKGIVNLVEAIKGKLIDVFSKYGSLYEYAEIDDSPY